MVLEIPDESNEIEKEIIKIEIKDTILVSFTNTKIVYTGNVSDFVEQKKFNKNLVIKKHFTKIVEYMIDI